MPKHNKLSLQIETQFLEDLNYWVSTDRKIALKILKLLKELENDPTQGTGKPEHLKYFGGNVWSRRINQKDRLVYEIFETHVSLLQCRFHY